MEKTATLNLRVNPVVKQRAEAVLARLGIPMSTAIDIYLNQIAMTGGRPFPANIRSITWARPWIRPHRIKVQLAPCQIPLTRKTSRMFP